MKVEKEMNNRLEKKKNRYCGMRCTVLIQKRSRLLL